MSGRKRRTDGAGDSSVPKQPVPDTQDFFNAATEATTAVLFDPTKLLLQRVSFLNPEKRYISVGFYPDFNYQPFVELGAPKHHPILLTEQCEDIGSAPTSST
jgi:hypothetical protein